jgi:hypothetical protein
VSVQLIMSLNTKFLKFIRFYAYQYIILYCAVRSATAFKEDDWLTIILTLPAVLVGSEFMRRDVIKIHESDARADGDPHNKRELDNLEV